MSQRLAVLAASVAAATLTAGVAVAAPGHDGHHATARASHQSFAMTFLTLKGKDRPTHVVAAGPIHGRGTMVERVVHESRSATTLSSVITLPGGKVTLRVRDTGSISLDKHSCTARQNGKGIWKVVSGTGAYRGATGHGTFVRRAFVVGAFGGDGRCLGESAPPASVSGTVVATGSAAR